MFITLIFGHERQSPNSSFLWLQDKCLHAPAMQQTALLVEGFRGTGNLIQGSGQVPRWNIPLHDALEQPINEMESRRCKDRHPVDLPQPQIGKTRWIFGTAVCLKVT
jgi:hypothetical protein